MRDSGPPLRAVSWGEVFPSLMLLRAFRPATAVSVLVLATLGFYVDRLGVGLIGAGLIHASAEETAEDDDSLSDSRREARRTETARLRESFRESIWFPFDLFPLYSGIGEDANTIRSPLWARGGSLFTEIYGRGLGTLATPRNPIYYVAYRFVNPTVRLFDLRTDFSDWLAYALSLIWGLAVWSLFGGAIARIAVVRLAREQRIGFFQSLDFSGRRILSSLGGPGIVAGLIAALSVLPLLLGVLMWADWSLWLVVLFWPLVLVLSLASAVLLLGIVFGWPLMCPVVVASDSTGFDAVSQSYSFVFQRPLHYLLYLVGASLIGLIGWLLVWTVADLTVDLAFWAASWGTGSDRMIEIIGADSGAAGVLDGMHNVVYAVATAFAFAFFWSEAAAMYLLLRYHVDHTEMDEIYLPEETCQPLGLPSLSTDEEGVPGVAEIDPPEETPASS